MSVRRLKATIESAPENHEAKLSHQRKVILPGLARFEAPFKARLLMPRNGDLHDILKLVDCAFDIVNSAEDYCACDRHDALLKRVAPCG
jgi:hypothetical protein